MAAGVSGPLPWPSWIPSSVGASACPRRRLLPGSGGANGYPRTRLRPGNGNDTYHVVVVMARFRGTWA